MVPQILDWHEKVAAWFVVSTWRYNLNLVLSMRAAV